MEIPVEAIKFRMEQSGLAPRDLVPMIGPLIKQDERRKAA